MICGEDNNSLVNLILPQSPPSAQCRKNNGSSPPMKTHKTGRTTDELSLFFHVEQIMVDIDDDDNDEQR